MTHAQVRQHFAVDASLGRVLQQAMEELHLLEAIQYRSLDRNLFC